MRTLSVLLAMLAALAAGPGLAQTDYPTKPIRIVVGFPPGGANDIMARLLGARYQQAWGESVVIDNRPGANSIIATELVAKAQPDGYTLLSNASGMVTIPAMYASLPFDVLRDFEPVTMLSSYPVVLVASSSLPVHSVKELIQLAKSQPGKLNYGAGASMFQLAFELFKQQVGIDINHIPYKGSAQAINAVLANDVQLTIVDSPPVVPLIRSGRLRGLAVTSGKRTTSLPELPTMKEAGMPDYEITGWGGLFAPAGTPKPIIGKLHQEAVRMLQNQDIRDKFIAMGAEPVGSTPEQFASIIKVQLEKWKSVARIANIKAE